MILKPEDLKIETFRAKGCKDITRGANAVKITHIPTGTVVTSENEHFLELNRDKALKLLKEALK